ncbi:MAG: hypothetical protein IIY30_08955 [Erysipelotrichaceae bacterium]|nr:hypothetical protein [Erysipelotrichaceae bacterium]MBQ2138389.1 hypothetical protein [Erysipelotrichaceae bacterium]MBQ2655725.1 hypothetical protein [Erysipelotrichaceae bacterium]MBQ5555657.1 hypothetical protein [Erysipelotrichaceae bacterium]
MALILLNFESKYLCGNTDVNIILPEADRSMEPKEYYRLLKKYKVLCLLHDTYGDYSGWVRKTNVELYAYQRKIAVVMPSASNSNYADWDCFALGYKVYSYFTEELMPMIYASFPISSKREDNYIAGLSMGGKGAFLYALNHPELFKVCYSFLSAPRPLTKPDPKAFSYKREENLIANFDSLKEYKASPLNLWDLTKKATDEKIDLPDFYFACGNKDEIAYEPFVKFREYSKKIGFAAKFYEIEGYRHEWPVWDLCLQDALIRFFGKRKKNLCLMRKNTKEVKFSSIASHKRLAFF